MIECFLCAAISLGIPTYEDDIRADGLAVHVAFFDPFRVFVSWEEGNLQTVGQTQRLNLLGAGAGYRLDLGRAAISIEGGRFWPTVNGAPAVQAEIITRSLINDHGDPGWTATNFDYDLHAGWGGSVEGSLKAGRWVEFFIRGRLLKLDEDFDMCTGSDPECNFPVIGNHWQNRKTRSLVAGFIGAKAMLGRWKR